MQYLSIISLATVVLANYKSNSAPVPQLPSYGHKSSPSPVQYGGSVSENLECEEVLDFDPRIWDCREVQISEINMNEFDCFEETDFTDFDCSEDEGDFICDEEDLPPTGPTLPPVVTPAPIPTGGSSLPAPTPGGESSLPAPTPGADGGLPAPGAPGASSSGTGTGSESSAGTTGNPTIKSAAVGLESSLITGLILAIFASL
ncbi:hypothetical protein HDV02_000632 [Globomyces sp. JEL0801]|nr:hypothetical protein HDV02_000632 [Globomyces sp. JEL0801]